MQTSYLLFYRTLIKQVCVQMVPGESFILLYTEDDNLGRFRQQFWLV